MNEHEADALWCVLEPDELGFYDGRWVTERPEPDRYARQIVGGLKAFGHVRVPTTGHALWVRSDKAISADFKPTPSLSLRSPGKGGRMEFWWLTEPLTSWFLYKGNARLAHFFSVSKKWADMHFVEISRETEVLRADPVRYTAKEVVGWLMDPPERTWMRAA